MNGTAALHIALKLADVLPGDLVMTQSLTFVATCNAIAYCSARTIVCGCGSSHPWPFPLSIGCLAC